MVKKSENILLIIMVTFLSLSIGTFLHDPLLHGFIALINGWDISSYQSYLTTGSTTAQLNTASALEATTGKLWLFFMFPSLFLFFGSWLINIFYPDKLTRIVGTLVMALNLGSLEPANIGSDADKATQVLINGGWTEAQASMTMWGIMVIAVLLLALFLAVVIEDSNKDAKGRMMGLIPRKHVKRN